MAKNGFRVIDAEPHFEEPYDLWEKNLPEKWRSRIKIIAPDEGHKEVGGRFGVTTREGDTWIADLRVSPEARKQSLVWNQAHRRWKVTPHLVEARVPYSRPDVYIQGFEAEGVDVGAMMPTTFGHVMTYDDYDPGLALAMCQIYNDWAHDWCQANPERFKWWGVVPIQDPKAAGQEASRCMRQLGAVGITAKDGGGHLASDEDLAPLWEALDDLQAPVGFHGWGGGSKIRPGQDGRKRTEFHGRISGPHVREVCALTFGGVLDRYPHVKPVFMESGVNAVPAMLCEMDKNWSLFGPDLDYELAMKPSEYYKARCYTVTYDEELLKFAVEYLGDDHLVFSTDYPHHDAPFPNGVKWFLDHDDISRDTKRKILWDNGARLFGVAG